MTNSNYGKSATIKPEVGQVWKRKGSAERFVHITAIAGNMPFVHFLETDLTKDYIDLELFLELYEYIGKAVGSTDDLFKVKE